ncbi:Hypothetical protein NocV09_00204370 [Nannochloropsis oceanica]
MALMGMAYALVFAVIYSPQMASSTADSLLNRGLRLQHTIASLRISSNTTASGPSAVAASHGEEEEDEHSSADLIGKNQNVGNTRNDYEPLVGGSLWQALDAEMRARPDFEMLTSTKDVQPFRSPEEMARAQACFRQSKGYGYLLHMRKAGGSTLRGYLSSVVEKQRDHLIYVSEGLTFNVSCFQDQGELVMVTSLRHPMARILSSYWYEGRYDSKPAYLEPGTSTALAAAVVNQTEIEATLPASFSAWVRFVRRNDYIRWAWMSTRWVWYSVDSYYIQTLTNRYRKNTRNNIGRRDFELAKRVLASFDLVSITEWMDWKNQTSYIQHALGQDAEELPYGLLQRNKLSKPKNDSEIDRDFFAELWRANTWDILLYEYAQNLVRERLVAFQDHMTDLEQWRTGSENKGVATGARKSRRQQTDQLECRAPRNDPRWRKRKQDYYKPNNDSYLYVMPRCMDMGDEKRGA